MKSYIRLFVALTLVFSLLATKCKDEPKDPVDGKLNLKIELYNGSSPITWNDVISTGGMNEFRMDFFRFYLSHLKANKGSELTNLADVVLADASNNMSFTYDMMPGGYDGIAMGIGLDALQNASDPVTFANTHPLSVAQSMYWSWAAKYRFVRIDGRANKLGTVNSPDDVLLALHPGADEFYRQVAFAKPFIIEEGKTTTFVLKLDVAKFFDGPGGTIDLQTEPQTHTSPEDYHIAEKFTDNFAAAFSLN